MLDFMETNPSPPTVLETSVRDRKQAFMEALKSRRISPPASPEFMADLETVFEHSRFIAHAVTCDPGMLMDLVHTKDLYRTIDKNTFDRSLAPVRKAGLPDTHALTTALSAFRQREMVRIAWRDITGLAGLEETLDDLSALARACIQLAVETLHQQLCAVHGTPVDVKGAPMQLMVLGMGKLGAGELNFSSDIDLIFAFPEEGRMENPFKMHTCEQFFTRLCRAFLKVFQQHAAGSPIFRVDTRLRPFGDSGPLVMSAEAMEIYYQTQGREWERYALIKAHPVAGDTAGGERLLERLKPFIFRRYLDYGTFDAFRDMKQRIAMQVRDRRLKHNIKLGPGGIREIEFFGQLFQLIRGGVSPQLQEKKILRVLELLTEENLIPRPTAELLSRAYALLRTVEHRLQQYDDRQTHDLPTEDTARLRLARAMGEKEWTAFKKRLDRHMETVHEQFNRLLAPEGGKGVPNRTDPFQYLWENINDPQFELEAEPLSGYPSQEKVVTLLKDLAEHPHTRKLTRNGRHRLNGLVPQMIRTAAGHTGAETVLDCLISLIIAIEQRTCYLALLLENPPVLATLATLATKSPWIISFLSQHPALLDELLDPETLYKPTDRATLEQDLAHRMAAIPGEDLEFLLEELCIFKQTHTLRVAAADISGDYPLMKVSDALTDIAETVLKKVLAIAWQQVERRYGIPGDLGSSDVLTPGFAAVAYGKLGGIELGYKSDLDLVFIHGEKAGTTTGGPRAIDNITFYTRLGQRIISMLTLHTPAGTLYEPDMRLRPSGTSGMIVSHIDAFREYMEKEAWTWEHQAIIRARPVAGDPALQQQFNTIRKQVIMTQREPALLQQEIREMRERLQKERSLPAHQGFDLKQGSGGIVDIEFLIQFLTLRHARHHCALVRWTDTIRLIETLAKENLLTRDQAAMLTSTYIDLRRTLHRRSLQEKPGIMDKNPFPEQTRSVAAFFHQFLYT